MAADIDQELLKRSLRSKKKVPKASPITPPSSLEREYFKDIKKIMREVFTLYSDLFADLERISDKIDKDIPQIRTDAGERDIATLLNRIKIKMGNQFTRSELEQIINRNLNGVKRYNDGSIRRLFNRVADVNLFLDDAPLETLMGLATANNVNLITTLMDETHSKVENIVYEGFRTGVRHEEIAKQVRSYIDPRNENVKGNLVYRAKFIARDQVSKLNAQITEKRQTSLGIKKYIWRTSQDERVRDSHKRKEGRVFSWSNPPSDTGHPGEDFNCRCTAEPVLDDLVE